MSYILEALRKAEAQRELGDAPDLLGAPVASSAAAPAAPTRARARPWLWLVAGAALPLVVVIGWRMLSPSAGSRPAVLAAAPTEVSQGATVPGTTARAPATSPLAPPAAAPAPALAQEPAQGPAQGPVPGPAVTPVPAQDSPPAAQPAPAAAVQAAAAAASVAPPPARKKLPPRPPPVKRATVPATAAPAPTPGTVRTLAGLPEDLRRQVPAMAIGGSVYAASPADRMLIINGQVVREGTALSPELRLETIGRQSAVFSIRGERFEMKL